MMNDLGLMKVMSRSRTCAAGHRVERDLFRKTGEAASCLLTARRIEVELNDKGNHFDSKFC